MAFTARDVGPANGIVFRPLFDIDHQRYSAYWRVRRQSVPRQSVPGGESGEKASSPLSPLAVT
jgi:hypothetical protein